MYCDKWFIPNKIFLLVRVQHRGRESFNSKTVGDRFEHTNAEMRKTRCDGLSRTLFGTIIETRGWNEAPSVEFFVPCDILPTIPSIFVKFAKYFVKGARTLSPEANLTPGQPEHVRPGPRQYGAPKKNSEGTPLRKNSRPLKLFLP